MLVLSSALVGCAEGMIGDRMIAERTGKSSPWDDASIRQTFATVVKALGS